ncbi:hypothetical protein D3C87_1688450 [compost metagenome]
MIIKQDRTFFPAVDIKLLGTLSRLKDQPVRDNEYILIMHPGFRVIYFGSLVLQPGFLIISDPVINTHLLPEDPIQDILQTCSDLHTVYQYLVGKLHGSMF